MKTEVEILRYNPETDSVPHWESYQLELDATDRVLDALQYIKWHIDGTLSLRYSCAHGVCGSDAMLINGHNRLACKTLLRDVGSKVTIEPLRGMTVIKDLIVDMKPFFSKYRDAKPYFISDDEPPAKERLQSVKERERFDDTTKCILCAACTASCPSFWANDEYIGPAAIVQAHRFIFDSRDQGTEERLEILNEWEGVWRCRTIFNCVEACPRDINVTKAIGEVKKAILFRRR